MNRDFLPTITGVVLVTAAALASIAVLNDVANKSADVDARRRQAKEKMKEGRSK